MHMEQNSSFVWASEQQNSLSVWLAWMNRLLNLDYIKTNDPFLCLLEVDSIEKNWISSHLLDNTNL